MKKKRPDLTWRECKRRWTALLAVGLFLWALPALAQTKRVTGTVTDQSGEPLPGATVTVTETGQGVITNLDGAYALEASPEETLEFSYVGMTRQRIPVGDRTVINVQLQDDAQLLAETVVIGYGSAKKRDLTGSIANIRGEELADKPVMNAAEALQGRVAGVQVINSGQAGAEPEIRVRGTNSINGYKPLYVVDGLLTDNITAVNPQDIESMEILKDPSSLAIFGVRGANGVIIVTTKRAREGKAKVSIHSSFGWKAVTDRIALTDAAQFKTLYNEQLANEGNPAFDFSSWNGNTDWQDEIFQNSFVTSNNISITAATDKNSFYMSLGYAYEQGSIKHEKYSKVTLNLGNDYRLTEALKVGFRFNGARLLPADSKSVLTALRAAPVAPVYNEELQLYTSLPPFQKAQMNNPMVDVALKANTTKAENYQAGGNIYGEWDIMQGLQFKVMYALDYASNSVRRYTPVIRVYDEAATGGVATLGDGKTGVGQEKQTEVKVQSDYLLTYTNTWGGHSLTATAGFTTYYNRLENLNGARTQGVGLLIPDNSDKWYLSIGDAATATNGSTQWERSTLSILARALYNYRGRYLLNVSYRRDGSSAFAYTGNEWQNFYAVGLGWLMSEEEWMKSLSWLDMLKLKASWGTLGNQNLGEAYPAQPLLTNAYSAVFGTPSAIYPGYQLAYLPNPDLRWEKVEAWEAGFEANFLRNRLHAEMVYYHKKTKDLLTQVPGISGTVPGMGNLGAIANRGVELALSWRDHIGEWNYDVGLNLTTIRNRVQSLVQEGYSIIAGDKNQSYTMAGYPIGYFYGYQVEGVYQTEAEIAVSPRNTLADVTPGDLKFRDVNGDGEITPADRTMIGNPTPDVTYGITLGLGWRNWELGIDMMGQGGNQIFRTWDNYNFAQFNYMAQRLQRWHGEGTSNSQPLLDTKHSINFLNSDYYVENGAFFRIRNIALAYNFDPKLIAKAGMQALKLYVNIQNVKTWKHNTGYTPELGGSALAFGVDNGSYPLPAVYTFGVNVTF
ncbi:MAG: TonB-dependent receptor [Bacteroides sp.]|nr:TonB-dependent receptor [Bacteroides sp.]